MRYVKNLLNSDVEINLMEVVTQNKDVISSKLELEMNSLDSVAARLIDRMDKEQEPDFDTLRETFFEYSIDNGDTGIFISDTEGNAYFADKSTVDISGRRYFLLASQGVDNISDRVVSRLDGEEIFVFSIPIVHRKTIIGTIQKSYSAEDMYELCSISLYSSKGYMYIINEEGYILISSRQEMYSREAENYFRMIYSQGNHKESEQLQNDIKEQHAGFVETTIDGETTFSAYTPLKDIHDWYLISSVATSAVASNANSVIRLFYFILFMVVVALGVNLWAFLAYKNRQQEKLKHIAFVDSVTSGNTYNKFMVDLEAALLDNPGKTYYLLKFDIDNFKYVNNFYGFDMGDKILSQIYHTISEKLHDEETIARISSDNFAVLLTDAGEARLTDILDSTYNDEGISICFSAGIYIISDPKESISLMVDKASAAAAMMKNSLDKKVCFYSEKFDQQMIQNEQLKRAVKDAIADDEMVPFYQSKVDINTGGIVGAEALVRWRRQDGQLVPPGAFIPMCEKTGLVTSLDMCIFEKVLRFQRNRLAAGLPCVPVSVNFSRLHLLDKEFLPKVLSKIQEYGVPPALIELELTESAFFDNHDIMTEFIMSLHEAGFLIAMDDFGSGYSSLNMLKDVPIDVLKIDKGFLDTKADSERQKIIFSAIVDMAHQLRIKIIVEGVEEKEQVELMRQAGCSIAQGFYFSRPVDEETFTEVCEGGIIC